jgi:SAM-dependent methyltransferase
MIHSPTVILRSLWHLLRTLPRKLCTWRTTRMTNKAAPDLSEFDLLPKGQYDYVPKGTYVSGPADRFLLVEKNRYRVVLHPGQEKRRNCGIGWVTEDNMPEGYDMLWGDDETLTKFREEGDGVRVKLTREIVDHIIELIPEGARVVDIGCGAGDLLEEMWSRRSDISINGCDFSSKAVSRASRSMPGGHFVQHFIKASLPYDQRSFDVVLCTDTIEHLEYPLLIVKELVRICRPNGLVVIVVPDGDVDQFLGHLWFWNKERLGQFLAPWDAKVWQLSLTREIIALINVREIQEK